MKATSTPRFVSPDEIRDHLEETHEAVARRAFEIFEGTARPAGRELEHWFNAEAELLHRVEFDLTETPHAVSVRAELGGFGPKDVELAVEPRRITISGKRDADRKNGHQRLFGVVELPAVVDTSHAKASLRGGVLALELPKA